MRARRLLAMLMLCPNISIAARQITQLVGAMQSRPTIQVDSIHCAIAAYHASWDRPDNKFANAVFTSVAKGDALNSTCRTTLVTARMTSRLRPLLPAAALPPRSTELNDQQQGWSSALFLARSRQLGVTSSGGSLAADPLQESSAMTARPMAAPSHDNGLFARSCLSGARNDRFEPGSYDFAWCRAFGRKAWERRPTDRRMATDGKIKRTSVRGCPVRDLVPKCLSAH